MSGTVAVIGAGPAGLAAAHRLVELGHRVDLFEASHVVGGMARSVALWDQAVELGPHIFAGGDARALALWRGYAGTDASMLTLRRGVESPFGTLEYPYRPGDLVARLPISLLLRGGADLARARLASTAKAGADDSEEWITRRYGRTLYDVLLRSYVEKMWGASGRTVDVAFARALIGARSAAVRRRVTDDVGNANEFVYPRRGASTVWEAMALRIQQGGRLTLDAHVSAVIPARDGSVTLVVANTTTHYARLISTIPLGRLLTLLPDVPPRIVEAQASLRARNVVVVHLLVTGMARSPYLWLYVQDPTLRVGRITDTSNWGAGPGASGTVVTMEYWCSDDDPLWRRDDDALVRLAAGELQRTGAGRSSAVKDGRVTRVRGALPVPHRGYGSRLSLVQEYVANLGVETAGRHGSFTIGSMADVMAEGIEAADRVAERERSSQSGTSVVSEQIASERT